MSSTVPIIFYIQTGIVPILMLLAIFVNSRGGASSTRMTYFSRCTVLLLAILATDLAAWALDGVLYAGAREALFVINTLPFVCGVVISYSWFRYVYAALIADKPKSRIHYAIIVVPMLVFCVLIVANFGTGLLFYINDEVKYVRGPAFVAYLIATFGYLLAAAILALVSAFHSPTKSKRNECLVLASFVVLPIAGAIAQTLGYGLSLVWPLASISLLIVYLGQINQSISLDALTGLNNRGQLDKLLFSRCNEGERNSPIYLAIIDVNGFKNINDTYGHVFGDKALVYISEALKKAFNDTDAFLARYGGDEFAVVLESETEEKLLDKLNLMNDSLKSLSQKLLSFSLTVSYGVACYETDCSKGVEWFIASADAKMYEQKQEHRMDSDKRFL